jgi:hypothetical protein
MGVYMWKQGNSGGVYALPALFVLVEAPSAREARDFAIEKWGISFNDSDGSDCECCIGSRWGGYMVEDEEDGIVVQESESLGDLIEGLKSQNRHDFERVTWKGETLPLYVSGKTPSSYEKEV